MDQSLNQSPARVARSRPGFIRGFIVAAVVVLATLVFAALWLRHNLSATGAIAATVEVKPTSSTADVVEIVYKEKLIHSPWLFTQVLSAMNAIPVRAGYYDLTGTQDMLALARSLRQGGRPRLRTVVIPEGFRIQDISNRLQQQGWADAARWSKSFADTSDRDWYRGKPSLEGFLFPATYEFSPEATPAQIRRQLLQRFDQEVTPQRLQTLQQRGLSVYEWVTLASMVQAEAGKVSEMPVIAGVFLNRLDDGMKLQSDPTVAYGLGKKMNELNRNTGDFRRDTPHNTYTRTGLPLTPIANPGSAALQAVLEPVRRNARGERWLYFLHGRDGGFYPNVDFNGHIRDNTRFR
jgi:UPF0755 protein